MKNIFADLHIHIGANLDGRPVKITASSQLTFTNIIKECLEKKGIDLVGIVDCAAPGVIKEIEKLTAAGQIVELPEGGFLHKDRVTVILGSEIETVEKNGGGSHPVAYFPFFRNLKEFSRIMSGYITNIELSSQRASLSTSELLAVTEATGGVLIPAHTFTPYKSVYGNAARRLKELIGKDGFASIPAIELGLSADTEIADHLAELAEKSFLSNSDAHSLPKIAREYNLLQVERVDFKELMLALNRRQGRKILANFGLDPKLGKYNRTFCHQCNRVAEAVPPVVACQFCGENGDKLVIGVYDRVVMIEDYSEPVHPSHRPPYYYQVALDYIPGITPAIYQRLLQVFGSEMAVLHQANADNLKKAIGWEIAQNILMARSGKLIMASGGGGHYGKVKGFQSDNQQLELL